MRTAISLQCECFDPAFPAVLALLPLRQLHSWGSQLDLLEGMEISFLTRQICSPFSRVRSPLCGYFPPGNGLGAALFFL